MTDKITTQDIEEAFKGQEGLNRRLGHCRVGDLIAEYPALKPKIEDAVHYSAPTVSQVLQRLGLPAVSSSLIRAHRRGDCRCLKEGQTS